MPILLKSVIYNLHFSKELALVALLLHFIRLKSIKEQSLVECTTTPCKYCFSQNGRKNEENIRRKVIIYWNKNQANVLSV